MAVLSIKSFGGMSPKIPPRYLKDSQAQYALNCPVFSGALVPIQDVGQAVHTVSKPTAPRTIYRFGQDLDSDSQHWFNWPKDVDVCRGQIAGDKSEWTFFTGDGIPRATYNTIATSGATLPSNVKPLGLPNPSVALTLGEVEFQPDTFPADMYLVPAIVDNMAGDYLAQALLYGVGVKVVNPDPSNTESQDYVTAFITEPVNATTVAAAINALPTVTAVEEKGGVRVTTVAQGEDIKLYVRTRTASKYDTEADFTPTPGGFDKQDYGDSTSLPFLVITDSQLADIQLADRISIHVNGGEIYNRIQSPLFSTQDLANHINSIVGGALTATVIDGNLLLTTPVGTNSLRYWRRRWSYEIDNNVTIDDLSAQYSDADQAATLIISQSELTAMGNKFLTLNVNGHVAAATILPTFTVADLVTAFKDSKDVKVTLYGTTNRFATLETTTVGPDSFISLREGTYPLIGVYAEGAAFGYNETPTAKETRVYTWTWVNKESGYEFESGPSDVSTSIDVFPDQGVNVAGRAATPVGYTVTHWRLYRSVAGVFLFVAELPIAETTYLDETKAELLAEELPTLTWSPPPVDLAGLTNLPNGIMAGFVGRDVYFCDPYHPHAWPQNYVQSLDYPVVGLGRMDTTLAVLTSGTPYFIQGSHPDSMTAVRSDLEQACASKRSIVSTNGVVMYASPDGLVLLSPGGSKVVTENLFTRAQWQLIRPESVHAYSHDMKYIGFYDNGGVQGGFIYDPTSGQFVLHDIYAEAGYADLRRDKLFVSFSDRTIKEWLAGPNKNYIWKSKKFTLPNVTSFSCAQVEAEAYPVTAKFYVDGAVVHTQTVADRNPFRLPTAPGRDMEVEIEGTSDVFAVSVAHSMQELAGV